MGLFKCWRSDDGSLGRREENAALMSRPHADGYSPVLSLERSAASAESQVSPLHSNRDWDWAQHPASAPASSSTASDLRASLSLNAQNVKASGRSGSTRPQDARPGSKGGENGKLQPVVQLHQGLAVTTGSFSPLMSSASNICSLGSSHQSCSSVMQDTCDIIRTSLESMTGLTEYSLQHLPGDTRSDFFVILRVESDMAGHNGPAPNGKATPATNGQIHQQSSLPGTAQQQHSPRSDQADYVLSPVFVSRRAMTGFTIMQVRDFAAVLRSQLLRDPLLAYALQRALRHVTSYEPRTVNHVLTDEDAGGPADPDGHPSLHVLQLLPCRWALSLRNSTSSTPVPALLLQYYMPHMPSPNSLLNNGGGGFGQIMPQLRDASILERVPNVVTLVDSMGRVLYQNEASLAYMGDWSSAHCAETMALIADHAAHGRHRNNGFVEDSVGASSSSEGSMVPNGACGRVPPKSVLALLLALEPTCAREVLDAVDSGQRWSRTVRVPASLKGKLFSSAALPEGVQANLTPESSTQQAGANGANSRLSSSSQAGALTPDDEEAVFVGCFTVRAKSVCEPAAMPDSPPGANGPNGHIKPMSLGHLDISKIPAGHTSMLSPLGMPRPSSIGDSLGSIGRPQSGGAALRYGDSMGSFLIPSGRMDSRSDGPQRRIVALLGGVGSNSLLRRGNGDSTRGGSLSNAAPGGDGRGTSLPKPSISPVEALQRLNSSHSEPFIPPPASDAASTPDGASSPDSTAGATHAQKGPFAPTSNGKSSPRAPPPADGGGGGSPKSSNGGGVGSPTTTPTMANGKRITFWDRSPTDGQSSKTNSLVRAAAEQHLVAERSSPNGRGLRPDASKGAARRTSTTSGAASVAAASTTGLAHAGSHRLSDHASEFLLRDRGPDLWHEVHAIPLVDPILDKQAILLVQMDVTRMVLSEERLGDLTDAQLSMLEQLFPRHVIEYMLSHAPSTLSRNLGQLASYHPQVTITFFDIVGFTSMSRDADARQVLVFLNELYTRFDELIDHYQLYKIDVVGDCYIVCAGLITKDVDGFERVQMDGDVTPEEAAWQARSVMAFCKSILEESKKIKMPNGERTQLRMGLHCGPVVSGLVGPKMPKFTCFGDSMNFASRMESTGKPGCIQASAAIAKLIPEECWVLTSGVQVKGIGIVDTYMWSPEEEVPPSPPAAQTSIATPASGQSTAGLPPLPPPSSSPTLPGETSDRPERSSANTSNTSTANRRVSISSPSDHFAPPVLTHETSRASEDGLQQSLTTAYSKAAVQPSVSGNARSRPPSAQASSYPGPQSRRGNNANLSRHTSISRPQSGRGLRNQMTISHNDPLAHSLLTVLAHIRETYPATDDSDDDDDDV